MPIQPPSERVRVTITIPLKNCKNAIDGSFRILRMPPLSPSRSITSIQKFHISLASIPNVHGHVRRSERSPTTIPSVRAWGIEMRAVTEHGRLPSQRFHTPVDRHEQRSLDSDVAVGPAPARRRQ